jgi:hypothetical protein
MTLLHKVKWLCRILLLSSALDSHAQAALTYNAHRYLDSADKNFDKNQRVKNQTSRNQESRLIRDVNVEILDGIAIVSFERIDPKTFKRQFVVDVWRDASHKLQHRYESPMRPGPKSIRPDGKG